MARQVRFRIVREGRGGVQRVTPQVVDLAFRLTGSDLPTDHGYFLFVAISKNLAPFHAASGWGVHPVRGTPLGNGTLALSESSRLVMRLPADDIRRAIPLAGKRLDVGGRTVRVGVPEIRPLRAARHLFSRFVTIKGFADAPEEFGDACTRQLETLAVREAQIGLDKRRVMDVKGYTIVGFSVRLSGLDEGDSVLVQERGLGGKRKMGAGIFVPIRPKHA
ncbi:MAG: type I-MYXAN CRISPR-associated protein Cas6/Cmx6 [Gammaproteobacteria bacterium]|nr:type I-MYXAN CRISPR-associated protein Cas6/Cmx6 [Gammaproteobacteria bacterium]